MSRDRRWCSAALSLPTIQVPGRLHEVCDQEYLNPQLCSLGESNWHRQDPLSADCRTRVASPLLSGTEGPEECSETTGDILLEDALVAESGQEGACKDTLPSQVCDHRLPRQPLREFRLQGKVLGLRSELCLPVACLLFLSLLPQDQAGRERLLRVFQGT